MSTHDAAAVPGGSLVRLFSGFVPAARRDDWCAEWLAELGHARAAALARGEASVRTAWRLRLRALGALRDALSVRRVYGRPRARAWGLREATRVLWREPGFALMVVCTLGLGIGAATAIFSGVDGLMLRPLPFREPERLVQLNGGRGETFSRYLDEDERRVWRAQDAVFEMARGLSNGPTLTRTAPGEPVSLNAMLIEPGLLRLLGTPPRLGREFLPDEGVPGRDDVVMLSDETWRTTFAGDAGVIGSTVHFDDRPYTVVGVLPPSVRLLPGGVPQLVLPLTDPPAHEPRTTMLLARLRPDVALPAAQARLDAVAATLAGEQPREQGWAVRLDRVERLRRQDTDRALTALGVAVLLLLLVACVNAAGLLFVRGVARRSELAVRRALGASRAALFRAALAESLVLAALAGLLGTALAWWGVKALTALAPPAVLRFSYNAVAIDPRVLGFALGLTLAVGLLFGAVPGLRAARTSAVHAGRRTATSSASEARLRWAVQVVQLALAVVLLTGAGLFGRSFLALTAVDPGYDSRDLLALSYGLPRFRYPDVAQRAAFNTGLDARLRALPGVRDIAWSDGGVAFAGFWFAAPEPEGGEPLAGGPQPVPFTQVDTAFFRVAGITLRAGRGFTAEDLAEGVRNVVIDVDLAARLWPDGAAVGRRFRIRPGEDWLTVVGVTNDVKIEGPDDPLGPFVVFQPTSLERLGRPTVFVRATGRTAAVAPAVRQALHTLDPALPVARLSTVEQLLGDAVAQPRFLLVVMGVFATVALLLAAVGVYGLVAFTVAQRTREIGIRMAIGARAGQILRAVLARGLLVAAAGLVLGIAGALALVRFVRGLLFGIAPFDPLTLAGVCVVLGAACAAALLVPARRAAAVDAASALRAE